MLTTDDIAVPPPADGQIVDPMSWFDSPGPFELEIGCGKGGFLLARAMAKPEARLLGIEWANQFYRFCSDRMVRRGIANVRVMRTDAAIFVRNHLPPQCLQLLHLYHPDPWPKKRHHKRRLVQQPFVEAAARALVPGGRWYIQTDHAEYFEQIRELLDQHPQLDPVSWSMEELVGPDWAGTNFEIKYAREGRAIYQTGYLRTS